ncbi:collagen triple helix repeat-containing protein 1-like isoform X2 [Montipora foliosa]|uniref:collagen triple helix repeat-containing protein 1-like isoform X2 n=1 Tax=Montipora foliosa TaxID=591990 RepID=UPI0035F15E26
MAFHPHFLISRISEPKSLKMVNVRSNSTPALTFSLVLAILSYFAAANDNCSQHSNNVHAPFIYGGILGMHGKPGSPGLPGRDGRDGREGAKGDQGKPGKPGVTGPAGANGKDGTKGVRGVQGPPGQKGERGESKTNGAPGAMVFKNWKKGAWKLSDSKENGLIKDCVFTKNFSDTALRVAWTGGFRVLGCTRCCKRWYFAFNGTECSAPLPIDGIVFLGNLGGQDPYRVRHIEGHCNNIHKGKVRVEFWVGNCPGYGNADAHTGWLAVSRIFVEEVPKPQA